MKILQKKANHLAAAVFSALMLTAAIGAPAVSAEHYNVYNYDCWGAITFCHLVPEVEIPFDIVLIMTWTSFM